MEPVRVSHIAAFARWKQQEDSDIDWLINHIRGGEQTEAMAKGTAFHKFLEHASTGSEIVQFAQDGYTFVFTGDFEISLPPMREIRRYKDYGQIVVTGQADCVIGNTIIDHKTTERFDAENYLEGWQYRYYLDLFGADRFIWNVWEMKQIDYVPVPPSSWVDVPPDDFDPEEEPLRAYEVFALHQLEQFRYPEMEAECRELAHEYAEFAQKWVPDLSAKGTK